MEINEQQLLGQLQQKITDNASRMKEIRDNQDRLFKLFDGINKYVSDIEVNFREHLAGSEQQVSGITASVERAFREIKEREEDIKELRDRLVAQAADTKEGLGKEGQERLLFQKGVDSSVSTVKIIVWAFGIVCTGLLSIMGVIQAIKVLSK